MRLRILTVAIVGSAFLWGFGCSNSEAPAKLGIKDGIPKDKELKPKTAGGVGGPGEPAPKKVGSD